MSPSASAVEPTRYKRVRALLLGERLDEDGTCTRFNSRGDKAMPIGMDTTQSDEERPRLHGAGVFGDMGNLTACDGVRGSEGEV